MRDRSTHFDKTQEELDDLFLDVLELPEDKRSLWLNERCDGNESLIDEIISLVRAHESSGAFLNDSQNSVIDIPSFTDYSGLHVGAWQLQSKIGQGGMGTVYKGCRSDGSYEQTVAIKVGPAVGLKSDLFVKERQVLAKLNHPVITKILDAGIIPESTDAFLVMEFVEGHTLLEYAHGNPDLTQRQKVALITSALQALHQAHCQGVIHCDIKPENIMVDIAGNVKLLDFGISSPTEDNKTEQEKSVSKGLTPAYASPQRLAGNNATIWDDIYGMGLMLGLVLIKSSDSKHINTTEIAKNLSPEIRSIFLKATHEGATLRYSSALSFMEDLNRWVNNEPVEAFNGGIVYSTKKIFQRHQFSSVAALLMVGVLAVSGLAWHSHSKRIEFEQAQSKIAVNMAHSISKDLDLRVQQLPGSLPARLATAEATISQIESIYQQQPNNPEIKAALSLAKLHLQSFYFAPSNTHIGEVKKGAETLLSAYELAYSAYQLAPSLDNLTVLSRATWRITEYTMIVDNSPQLMLESEIEILQEASKYELKGGSNKATLVTTLLTLFRIHMVNNDLEKARDRLNEAMEVVNVSAETLSEYERDRLSNSESRMLELNAVYSLVTKDYTVARSQFEWLADNFKNSKAWKDRRRSLFAHRALACIELQQSQPDYNSVYDHLTHALLAAKNLVQTNPNAVGFQWELAELERIEKNYKADNIQNTTDTTVKNDQIIKYFACDAPSYLHMPANPPEGWQELQSTMTFSFSDVIKPIN